VWADLDGYAYVWRRLKTGQLVREVNRFRPWLLVDRLDYFFHLNGRFGPEGNPFPITFRKLNGSGALRYLVTAVQGGSLIRSLLDGASYRLGRRFAHVRELGKQAVLMLPPEEQFLVATGMTYFRGLAFDDVRRMQFDLETTGLDPEHNRIFLVAVRHPSNERETLEARSADDAGERALIGELVTKVKELDPDVIENHNLHGFDLPFLARRAEILGVSLNLGRMPGGLQTRVAQRGAAGPNGRRFRYVAPGRELIDTLDAVIRYDIAGRELPGHGLKAVARHFGLAGQERKLIRGDQIYTTYQSDPDRVRRYAIADVNEVAGIGRLLGGATFSLAQIAPRRYERVADAGTAVGVIDPLLTRAYLRSGKALPAHPAGPRTRYKGAAVKLYAVGVSRRIVKADVASLYPSLMLQYRIGPSSDRLGALLTIVDRLLELRLAAKTAAKQAAPKSAEQYAQEAMSGALKIVINSAYGYLGAGGLTRFADLAAAGEVTRRGRETLEMMCHELVVRGMTLIEADTDGVLFAVPESWTVEDEKRVVAEVDALLPERIRLEYDGRYSAMFSYRTKNYALLGYDGSMILHGGAFRSSRIEPFARRFLREAVKNLLAGNQNGVRQAYLKALDGLRRRELPTEDVCSLVRLTKTPGEYAALRDRRKEMQYETLLATGRTSWKPGDQVRVYYQTGGTRGLLEESEDGEMGADPRDYDVERYVRQLHQKLVTRLVCAFYAGGIRVGVCGSRRDAPFKVYLSPPKLTLLTIPPVRLVRLVFDFIFRPCRTSLTYYLSISYIAVFVMFDYFRDTYRTRIFDKPKNTSLHHISHICTPMGVCKTGRTSRTGLSVNQQLTSKHPVFTG
jgi:DNA polymerase elongation subunit (family B)